ncbi:MAG: Rv1355c family protein [Sphingobacteriaceae bacterium]|nr:Rv1355c family protein [Sphingobacteriaceae bacterium]
MEEFDKKIKELKEIGMLKTDSFRPLFFNIRDSVQKSQLLEVLNTPGLEVVDFIYGQLKEYIKLKHPSVKLTVDEIDLKVKEHLGKTSLTEYGVWVYYPWNNKLIHILDRDEYISVRTNRNHYKITPDEEQLLFKKKIGIIGLSVGKAIAMTIATERICGELVLADFDEIELSNLNRIQTGVQNFGIKKTIVVAREIAEIDPYLKVTCYHEGLSEENIDDFFSKDGKLDICIEVCDGLLAKIRARQKAKQLGVAVVMNSSDRGTTDIERYDLNPKLPILHGLIDHLDLEKLKNAKTNEEKVPYLLPMLGVETSSPRLKASMLEIEQTITTWPQLASGVVLGGAICADVCRRILLNTFKNSGRYFLDIEDNINNEKEDFITYAKRIKPKQTEQIPKTELKEFENDLKEIKAQLSKNQVNDCVDLSKKEIEELVSLAITAPSGGNIQPWKWHYTNKHILLFNDPRRSKTILNYNNSANLISYGAALYNLLLASLKLGYHLNCNIFPIGQQSNLIASTYLTKSSNKLSETEQSLFEAIPKRITNRIIDFNQNLVPEEISNLKMGLNFNKIKFKIISDKQALNSVKETLGSINRLFLLTKNGHAQFNNEIRWSEDTAMLTRDGVELKTIDLTPTEQAGLYVSKDWEVMNYLNKWNLGNGLSKLIHKSIDSCSAIGVLTAYETTGYSFIEAGKTLQRIWLNATLYNISLQPISISTFLSLRINDNQKEGIEDIYNDLKVETNRLRNIFQLQENVHALFIFRLYKTEKVTAKSLRLPIEDVLIYE